MWPSQPGVRRQGAQGLGFSFAAVVVTVAEREKGLNSLGLRSLLKYLSFEQSVLKIISLENNLGLRYRFVDCEFPHCQDQCVGKKKEEKEVGRGDEDSSEKGKQGLCRGWLAEWLTNIPGPQ